MSEDFETCITTAKDELETARLLLQRHIAEYPAPIAGCDAQFNHILAERQKVLLALRALTESVFIPTPRRPDDIKMADGR